MPNVPKDLLEKMPSDAEIARLLDLKPTDAERALGYKRPADCVFEVRYRPNARDPQYVGVVTIDARKFRIWPDRIEDVYDESAPRPPVDRATLLRDAAARLDAADEEAWTKAGKPTLAALGDAAGLADVTADERDAALEAAQAS